MLKYVIKYVFKLFGNFLVSVCINYEYIIDFRKWDILI